jgi:hypothetical protein
MMRIVTANFRPAEQFLKHYSDAHNGGALFYRARMDRAQASAQAFGAGFPDSPGFPIWAKSSS